MAGYIKLYRKLLENPIFQNEKLLKVFIWCLLKSTHKEYETMVGLQKIVLQPGQFVFGRIKAAKELKLKESTLSKYMAWLKEEQILDIKSNNKYSVVTVLNWVLYQIEDEESNIKNNNKVTTKEQQSNTNKNVKNDKNNIKDLKDIYKAKFIPPTIEEVKTYCIERNNNINPEQWLDHYKSNGWMVGKTPMKDWKAAVRTWEQRNKREGSQNGTGANSKKFEGISAKLNSLGKI